MVHIYNGILLRHKKEWNNAICSNTDGLEGIMLLLLLLSRFSRVWLCATPQTAAHQAPPSLGFSRQEHWSGLPFPSPMHESEKWKWSRSVMSNSSRPHGLQPTRLLHPWDFQEWVAIAFSREFHRKALFFSVQEFHKILFNFLKGSLKFWSLETYLA